MADTNKAEAEAAVERVKRGTYKTALIVFVIFGISSAIAAVFGNYLDETYDIKPFGTIGIMILLYVLSWAVVAQVYIQMRDEMREAKAEENIKKDK